MKPETVLFIIGNLLFILAACMGYFYKNYSLAAGIALLNFVVLSISDFIHRRRVNGTQPIEK